MECRERGEREISGKIGVQFVYFNIDFTRQNILSGFLIQGGEHSQSSNIQLWELIFFKTFPFFAENDSEVTGIAVLCQKTVLV